MSKCKYCGSSSYGRVTDGRHPESVHIHTPDPSKPRCIYCGSTSTGRVSDGRHPNSVHEVQ